MNRFITRKVAVIAALVVGIGAVGGGTALAAAGSDDDATDRPIAGSALEQAKAAALAHTGQGKATETEVGDEESYYEVEVTLDTGNQVERRGLSTSPKRVAASLRCHLPWEAEPCEGD